MSWAAAIGGSVALATVGVGAYQKGRANKRLKATAAQRKPYQTPDEIFEILNATQSKAQGDTITRDYNQNQLDMSFGDALGTAELLGAGSNNLSALFSQKIQGQLQVGEQFHASNMESFGKYMNALNMVAENKAAEGVSSDNMLKDLMQAYAQQKADANTTINSGINGLVGAASMYGTNQLYKDKKTPNDSPYKFTPSGMSVQNGGVVAPVRTVGAGAMTIVPRSTGG